MTPRRRAAIDLQFVFIVHAGFGRMVPIATGPHGVKTIDRSRIWMANFFEQDVMNSVSLVSRVSISTPGLAGCLPSISPGC